MPPPLLQDKDRKIDILSPFFWKEQWKKLFPSHYFNKIAQIQGKTSLQEHGTTSTYISAHISVAPFY